MEYLLTPEEIQDIWEEVEKQRFEHPDADKPDFQLFDPLVYGEAIAKAQLAKAKLGIDQLKRDFNEKLFNQTMEAKKSGWDDAVKSHEWKAEQSVTAERERIIKQLEQWRDSGAHLISFEAIQALKEGK